LGNRLGKRSPNFPSVAGEMNKDGKIKEEEIPREMIKML